MTSLLVLELGLFVLLLAGSGFFSSAETALFSLKPHEVHRIEESSPEIAAKLRHLLAAPTRLLSTILIGNTVINVQLWIVGALLMTSLGFRHEWGQVGVLTLLTLIFGEFGPKRLAILLHVRLSRVYASPLTVMVGFLKLPRAFLESLTGTFSHFFMPSGHIISRTEYDALMDASEEAGDLDEHEHKMVREILLLEKQTVGDVMTPRVDLVGIDLADPEVDILEEAKQAKVRHLVLYEEQLDNIVGLLDLRAYLFDPAHNLPAATLVPFFIPELCTLDKLLTQMLTRRKRVAVVVDEYGGTAGLITRGDILEELTGEMDAEHRDRLISEQLTESAWLLDARMSLLDARRITGLDLTADTADRLSGWFLEKAEHLPRVNEIIRGPGYKAMVRQMRRNRILLILVEKKADAETEEPV